MKRDRTWYAGRASTLPTVCRIDDSARGHTAVAHGQDPLSAPADTPGRLHFKSVYVCMYLIIILTIRATEDFRQFK